MPTIKDVANEAGVALSTVSKYLNGGNVREENREKIERAVEKLGFQMNFHAHAMRSGISKMVLVMVTQFEDAYCCEMMQTARRVLIERGYIAVLAETRGDPKKEQEIVRRAVTYQVDGVIALHTGMSTAAYEELHQNSVPLVVIGRVYGRKRVGSYSGCVYFDDAEKFTKMFRRLRANGHSRIGIVGGGVDKARLQSREFSYYLGLLSKSGLEIDERYIYVDDVSPLDTGVDAVNYFLALKEPPTAIVCLNSGLLMGVSVGLSIRSYRVPEDVSIVVLARSSERSKKYFGNYSAVCQPLDEATERAVDMLLDSIKAAAEGKSQPHTMVQLPTELVQGKTIGPANDSFGRRDNQSSDT